MLWVDGSWDWMSKNCRALSLSLTVDSGRNWKILSFVINELLIDVFSDMIGLAY